MHCQICNVPVDESEDFCYNCDSDFPELQEHGVVSSGRHMESWILDDEWEDM